ncbi:MAG: hypothetical protein ABJQ85_05045 [Rhizobiaceae bacterium]
MFNWVAVHFSHPVTGFTDQQLWMAALAAIVAGNIGISGFNAVNIPQLQKRLQGPIDLYSPKFFSPSLQCLDNLVGAECPMLLQQNIEDFANMHTSALV